MKKRIARSSVLHIILIITAIAAAMLCRQLDRIGTMQIFGIIRSLIYIFMFLIWGMVDYNIKCNTKKYGHHTHFRVKCNYHKTKGTEVEYEVLYTFYTI